MTLRILARFAAHPVRAAQFRPPPGALPLSVVLRGLEAESRIAWFAGIGWDCAGHWMVDFIDESGRQQGMRIDPVTGAPLG